MGEYELLFRSFVKNKQFCNIFLDMDFFCQLQVIRHLLYFFLDINLCFPYSGEK